eukprot:scaffold104716_cov54-Attheya_sp.AAC.2
MHTICSPTTNGKWNLDLQKYYLLLEDNNFSTAQKRYISRCIEIWEGGLTTWDQHSDKFTENGRYRALSTVKRCIQIDGIMVRYEFHHGCLSELGGSDVLRLNACPIIPSEHDETHILMDNFISDNAVTYAANLMRNTRSDGSYVLDTEA